MVAPLVANAYAVEFEAMDPVGDFETGAETKFVHIMCLEFFVRCITDVPLGEVALKDIVSPDVDIAIEGFERHVAARIKTGLDDTETRAIIGIELILCRPPKRVSPAQLPALGRLEKIEIAYADLRHRKILVC